MRVISKLGFMSLSAVVFSLANTSVAQSSDPATSSTPENVDIEEIIVRGTALSRQRSIQLKRESMQISDALGVDELGQLPDKNIGESLNRVPGVTMLVEKGEGRFVQLRGIQPSLNNVTLNGISTGSPESDDGGRATPMDVFSAGMINSVQVFKTPTPDMDAQGIGGTVNLEVKKPFDINEDFYGYSSARYGFEEIRPEGEAYGGEDPYAFDALVSGKNQDRTFGWLLGGSYSSREYVAQGIFQDDWYEVTDGSGIYVPEEVKNNYYIIGRERINLSGVLEFQPNDESSYFVRAFMADWDEYQHRNRYQESLTEDVVADSSTSGTSGLNRVSPNIRLENANKSLQSISFGGENLFGNKTIDYQLQLNSNELDEPNSYWEFRSGTDFGPNSWSVNGDGIVFITPDASAADRQDPDLIDFRRARFQDRTMEEDASIAEFNFKWDLDDGVYFKTGMKYSLTERDNDYNQTRFDGGSLDLTLGTDPSFTNGAFTNDTDGGDVPNIWMDVDAMDAFIADPANADYFEENEGDTFASNFGSDYQLDETITAVYAMGFWEGRSAQVVGGLRIEATDIDSKGYVLLPDDTAELVSAGGDYVNLLPSVIVNYRLNENLLLRGAVSRGLGRPGYDAIAPISNYNEEAGVGSLSIGNPDLEARVSWNYDIAIEWYPNELTLLSASIFFKDIENELVGRSYDYSGLTDIDNALADLGLTGAIDSSILTDLEVSTTENGDNSELQGIELAAQTQFSNLPEPFDGLGLAVSASFIDAEVDVERNGVVETLPLPGQAESTYNMSLFYQRGPVDMALSYAYNDSFLTDIGGERETDLDQGEFGRWDLKASWQATEKVKVFLEAINLNNEPTSEFQGGVTSRNTEYEFVGRTMYLGASMAF